MSSMYPSKFRMWLDSLVTVSSVIALICLFVAGIAGVIYLSSEVSGWFVFLMFPVLVLGVGTFHYWAEKT